MKRKIKSINIKILYDLDEKYCNQVIINKLKTIYYFQYNNNTLIRELFVFLHKKLGMSSYPSDEELIERYCFVTNEKIINTIIDFKINDFLRLNHLDNDQVLIFFKECVGGGNGAYIDELAHIRINPSEPSHKYLPHVHVYKKNHNEAVRIDILTQSPLDNEVKNYYKMFSKKERNQIEKIIKSHKDELRDYYSKVQNGELVKEFIVEYNNKEFIFK